MTRTRYDGIGLEKLIHKSHGVFLAAPADPVSRVELVSILPEGSAFAGKNEPPFYEPDYHDRDPGPHLDQNYPPYRRTWHRFTLTEVLKARGSNPPAAGDLLEVCEGNSIRQEALHRMYYLEGKRKSPIYRCYERSAELNDTDPRLVFATRHDGAWHLTVAWATESAAMRDDAAAIIAAGPPGNVIYPDPA